MTEQERELDDLRRQVRRLTAERDAERARVAPLNKSAEQAVAEVIAKRAELREAKERANAAEKRAASLTVQLYEAQAINKSQEPVAPAKMLPNDGSAQRTWGKFSAMEEEAIAQAAARPSWSLQRDFNGTAVPGFAEQAVFILQAAGRRVAYYPHGLAKPFPGERRKGDAWVTDKGVWIHGYGQDIAVTIGWGLERREDVLSCAQRALEIEVERKRNEPREMTCEEHMDAIMRGMDALAVPSVVLPFKVGDCVRVVDLEKERRCEGYRGEPSGVVTELSGYGHAMVGTGIACWVLVTNLELCDQDALAVPSVVIPDTRRHNSTCPACHGPAYQGIGRVTCERVGGCVPWDIEPTDGIHVWPTELSGRERAWRLDDARLGCYATRDLAVAAWRAARRAELK